MSILTNRRKFLIGSAGIGVTSLVGGHALASDIVAKSDNQTFERYARFLNYEYAQVMRLRSIDGAITANPHVDPKIIRQTIMNEPLREQALYWFPDDCPKIVELCTSGRKPPMSRAKVVLEAVGVH